MEKGTKRPRDEDTEVKPLENPTKRSGYSQGPHHHDLALHPTLKAPRPDSSVSFLYVSFGTHKHKYALSSIYCLLNVSLVTMKNISYFLSFRFEICYGYFRYVWMHMKLLLLHCPQWLGIDSIDYFVLGSVLDMM